MFVVNPKHLRAAALCRSYADFRYYLNGVLVKPDGQVVATNGHVMYVAYGEPIEIKKDMILDIEKHSVPKPSDRAEINMLDDKRGYIDYTNAGGQIRYASKFFETVDGKFPDYQKIIDADKSKRPRTIKEMHLSIAYLSLVEKVFAGQYGVRVTVKDDKSPVFCWNKEHDELLVIMPMRF